MTTRAAGAVDEGGSGAARRCDDGACQVRARALGTPAAHIMHRTDDLLRGTFSVVMG